MYCSLMALNSSWPAVSRTNKPSSVSEEEESVRGILTVQLGHSVVYNALLGVGVLYGGVIVSHEVTL